VVLIAYRSGWAVKHTKIFNAILIGSIFIIAVESTSADFDQWSKDELPELTQVFNKLSGPAIFLPINLDIFRTLDIMQLSSEYVIPVANGYSGFTIPSMEYLRQDETLLEPWDLLSILMVTYDHIIFDKYIWLDDKHIAYIKSPEFEWDYWQTQRYLVVNSPTVDRELWTTNKNWLNVRDYFEPAFLDKNSSYVKENRWGNLKAAYDLVLIRSDPAAFISLAEELFKMGLQKRAIETLNQALSLEPDIVPSYCKIGDLFDRYHQPEKAREAYAAAVNNSPRFLRKLKNMKDTQQRYNHYCQLARAFENTDLFSDARALLNQASLLYPNRLYTHIETARLFGREAQLDSAVAYFKRALVIEPDNAKIKADLGNMYKAMKNNTKAEEFYREALVLKPDFSLRHQHMADLYMAQGKRLEALASLEHAVALESRDFLTYWKAAGLYKEIGKKDKMIQIYRHILSLNLDGGAAAQWQEMGMELYAAGHLNEAITAYRHALKLDRKLQAARINLGWCLG
jgi:tetratricopeptide (TPR) repeat protein